MARGRHNAQRANASRRRRGRSSESIDMQLLREASQSAGSGRASDSIRLDNGVQPIIISTIDRESNVVVPNEIEPDFEHVDTPRKRSINRNAWKCRQLNLIRREMSGCGCARLKCDDRISDNDALRIKDHFYSLRDYDDQQRYLFSFIDLHGRARPRRANNGNDDSRRKNTFRYYMQGADGQRLRVCKVRN